MAGVSFQVGASRSALGPTQLLVQWVRGCISPEVKRMKCKAENSHPSIAELKNGGNTPHSSIPLHGVLPN
jgi:hypothetical protein